MQTKKIEQISKAEEQFLIEDYDINPHDTAGGGQCLHMPDNLEFIQYDISGDKVTMEYDCDECGKRIQEIFIHSDTIEKGN